jgi:hypothetical protein
MFLHNVMLYIDPGTGSIILQAVVAGLAGVFVFIKFGWRRLLRFFGLKSGKKHSEKS